MTSAPDKATARLDDDEAIEVVHLDDARGLGIRARQGFAAGEIIHRFAGVVGETLCQHSLQVDANRHIGGTSHIGYLSHGCDPSGRLDMAAFTLVALCDIAAGDIVTIDYADTEDRLHRQFACRCRSPRCRGWIVGRDERPDAEGLNWLASRDAG